MNNTKIENYTSLEHAADSLSEYCAREAIQDQSPETPTHPEAIVPPIAPYHAQLDESSAITESDEPNKTETPGTTEPTVAAEQSINIETAIAVETPSDGLLEETSTAAVAEPQDAVADTVYSAEDNIAKEMAAATITTPTAAAPSPRAKTRGRGATPSRDGVWTRNHALCLMGAACDIKLGGYDAARAALAPLKAGVVPSEIATLLLVLCPWLLNPGYLNLEGSASLAKRGLNACFRSWVCNRVYYFYYDEKNGEHPYRRTKGNLRAVYREFYDAFSPEIIAGAAIPEERAQTFWLSVANRVPYLVPMVEPPPLIATPSDSEFQHPTSASATAAAPAASPGLVTTSAATIPPHPSSAMGKSAFCAAIQEVLAVTTVPEPQGPASNEPLHEAPATLPEAAENNSAAH